MSGFEPSLPSFRAFFRFVFRSLFLGELGGLIVATAPVLLFFIPYQKYACFWLSKLPNLWRTMVIFFWLLL